MLSNRLKNYMEACRVGEDAYVWPDWVNYAVIQHSKLSRWLIMVYIHGGKLNV